MLGRGKRAHGSKQTNNSNYRCRQYGKFAHQRLDCQHYPAEQLWASDPSAEKLDYLQKKFSLPVTHNNEEAIQNAETIIFALKPQAMERSLKNWHRLFKARDL